jgi:predicted ATPase/transcriptional regulator with XRE-family HTH domain
MSSAAPASNTTFGGTLKFLRKRAHLTQRELGIAVGYSETYITRLENDTRVPDPVIVRARFVEALGLEREPHLTQQLIDLAVLARATDRRAVPVALEQNSNLTPALTRFIGRQRELQHVVDLITSHRLVTLIGSGGVGKTRLAIEAGLRLLDHFTDGVQLTELAPIGDATLIAQHVAGVFKITNQTGRSYLDALRVVLAGKNLLLILDNCEHVIDACANLANTLLQYCPTLHILATSREALNIPGELAWRVPSMNTAESTQLFAERANAVKTGFSLNEANAGDVTAICTRLDGIPLAIELAASRLSALSVHQLASRLDDRFSLLTNGSRTALQRHQTLRALIAWSYDLLSDQERTLLRRLAVFAGGWTAEAAEVVCATPREHDDDMAVLYAPNVLPLLLGLVNKSLVIASDEGEQTRYTMLETIKQFAWEQLEQAGETMFVQRQHARYFLAHLKGTAPAKMRERDIPYYGSSIAMAWLEWYAILQPDRDNLRNALTWSLQQAHDIDTGIQLALWQHPMWSLRGPREEGYRWFELALTHTLPASLTHARVLAALASFVFRMGYRDRALDLYKEALVIFRRMGDRIGMMFTLSMQANIWLKDDDANEANIKEWLSLARELGEVISAGVALYYLALNYGHRGDATQALECYSESLSTLPADEIGVRHAALYFQAVERRQAGDIEGTMEQIQASLAFFRRCGFVLGVVVVLHYLGDNAMKEGDTAKAREYLKEGLETSYRDGTRQFSEWYYAPLAALAAAERKFIQAVTLAAVNKMPESQPPAPHNQKLIEHARAQLDEEALRKAETAGRSMTFDQAVAFALSL